MTDHPTTSSRKVIIENIHRLLYYWLEGRLERIADMIDDDVVMYLAQSGFRVEGKSEFVRVLHKYLRDRTIRRYDESDFAVETEGAISIAHYRYQMDYILANETRLESGIDLFVFRNIGGVWKLVRRSMLPSRQVIRIYHQRVSNSQLSKESL